MAGEALSFQEILRRRQQAGFVGREDQLAEFDANLSLAGDDPRRKFVYWIHGDGGVGKTLLLAQFRAIAADRAVATAYLNEGVSDIPDAMYAIHRTLGDCGEKLKSFAKLYGSYRTRRRAVESDADIPKGAPAILAQVAVRLGLVLQRHLWGLVSAAFVVADTGLVLASASPVRPGPHVVGRVDAGAQVDQEPAYLR